MAHFAISCPPASRASEPILCSGTELGSSRSPRDDYQYPRRRSNGAMRGPSLRTHRPEGNFPSEPVSTLLKWRESFRAVRHSPGGWHLRALLQHAPSALRGEGVDIAYFPTRMSPLLLPSPSTSGCLLPVSRSLPINRETDIPGTSPFSSSAFGYAVSDFLTRSLQGTLNDYRRRWGLRPLRSPDDSFSPCANRSNFAAEFDFPKARCLQPFTTRAPGSTIAPLRTPTTFPLNALMTDPLFTLARHSQSSTHRHFETHSSGMGLNRKSSSLWVETRPRDCAIYR